MKSYVANLDMHFKTNSRIFKTTNSSMGTYLNKTGLLKSMTLNKSLSKRQTHSQKYLEK